MNTAHFDSRAAEWDDNPARVALAKGIAAAIKTAIPLARTMSAMEFGCGTGLISRGLLPMVESIKAIDLSPGMIEQLQKRITEDGLQNISACCLDIFIDPPNESFDLIFSGMVLHHVPDTDALLNALTALLASGGFIALADLDTEDGSFHQDIEGFLHHGFNRKTLLQKLRACGFEKTAAVTAHVMHRNERDYPVFLITARKKA